MVGVLTAAAAASAAALALFLRSRRKTPAERERQRRLKVNALGRICDASIVEVRDHYDDTGRPVRHIHYLYTVGGVTYNAAQDISALRSLVQSNRVLEGSPTSVKYDPHNPSNSIVICELWSGLR